MPDFVAYYRVSTARQGQSGLGLDAQRAAVAGYLAGRGDLLAEFTEVESGKRDDRPQLLAALDLDHGKDSCVILTHRCCSAESAHWAAVTRDVPVH